MKKWDRRKYTKEQAEWCRVYHAKTGFEPVMDDFESGEKTFYEQARWNIDWFESWMGETHLAIQRNVPGEWEHLTAEVDALCTKSAPSDQKPVENQ